MTAPHSISGGTAELAAKLAEIPLDQSHFGWPTIAPVRLSETERDLIVAALRTSALPSGEVETAQAIAHELFANQCFAFTGEGMKPHSAQCQHAAERLEEWRLASSPAPQIAGDVPLGYTLVPLIPTQEMIEAGCDNNPTCWNDETDDGFAADVANDVYISMVKEAAALSPQPQSAPPFSRWADIIESASLTISPKGSEALNALAAEVRDYDVSKL